MKVHEGYSCSECDAKAFTKWTDVLKHKAAVHFKGEEAYKSHPFPGYINRVGSMQLVGLLLEQ